jgi:hypothetical protein
VVEREEEGRALRREFGPPDRNIGLAEEVGGPDDRDTKYQSRPEVDGIPRPRKKNYDPSHHMKRDSDQYDLDGPVNRRPPPRGDDHSCGVHSAGQAVDPEVVPIESRWRPLADRLTAGRRHRDPSPSSVPMEPHVPRLDNDAADRGIQDIA